ncbi:MupB [Pseudomonas savastanoi pv. phaseolicola]|uniref:MupB n=3 Tax=Pseudomonas savastanoi TaxID=29438 RepID=A0ABD4BHN7_PSESH|nr:MULTISPECIES: MupB [Pseudomonas]KPB88109.1 MupB [Pseudomonas syringae pv. maculicola]KPB36986.1 MupB [Pseudomonas savastanoi pv. phaseolicola]KPB38379.1 MupB [Pseudomonas savastanoi pv. phaseolicola]KPB59225.1 MupB [Pseudomonas amygdali pv. mellea]KPB66502.1 MupB [Pseudomonas savastanoi pv. phaseolicola]
MEQSIYLGGVSYETGESVDIAAAAMSPETLDLLRAPENNVKNFSHLPGDLFDSACTSVAHSLTASGRHASDIDAVFLISSMVDAQNNIDAQWLADLSTRLGMETIPFYAVGLAGCAGFHAGLKCASAMVASGDLKNALLLSFDQSGGDLQRVYGEGSDFIYVTGDAVSSCLVSRDAHQLPYKLCGHVQYTSNTRQIENFSSETDMRSISALMKRTYQQSSIPAASVSRFICNNYTLEATRLFCQLSGINHGKAVTRQLPRFAHCFGSDNLINLKQLEMDKELSAGDHILLFSTGPFQMGACIITCTAP